jgi:hypothetical protein
MRQAPDKRQAFVNSQKAVYGTVLFNVHRYWNRIGLGPLRSEVIA